MSDKTEPSTYSNIKTEMPSVEGMIKLLESVKVKPSKYNVMVVGSTTIYKNKYMPAKTIFCSEDVFDELVEALNK